MTNTLQPRFRSTARGARLVGLALLHAAVLGACSSGPPGASDAIDRQLFIDTYVDLRAAAIETEGRELSDEARAEVLARHGVTEEDLMRFAEVYGGEVELMSEVWNEVEVRLDGMRSTTESVR